MYGKTIICSGTECNSMYLWWIEYFNNQSWEFSNPLLQLEQGRFLAAHVPFTSWVFLISESWMTKGIIKSGRGEGMRREKQNQNFWKCGLGTAWLCYKLTNPTELSRAKSQFPAPFPVPCAFLVEPSFAFNHALHKRLLEGYRNRRM